MRNCYQCKDGKWILGTNTPEDRFWGTFCRVTGQESLLDDTRFRDEGSRWDHIPELMGVFDEVFLSKTRDQWVELFQENGLMFAPVQKLEEVLTDPQALSNHYVEDFDHPSFGTIKVPGFPVSFSANRTGTRTAAPLLGENTDSVLRDIGYSSSEIERLRDEGVIG